MTATPDSQGDKPSPEATTPAEAGAGCGIALTHLDVNDWTESMINQQQPRRETPFRTLTNEGNDV